MKHDGSTPDWPTCIGPEPKTMMTLGFLQLTTVIDFSVSENPRYMCYCKNSGGDLAKSIGDAGTKMPQLEADIKEGESKKVQLDEDLPPQTPRTARGPTAAAIIVGTCLQL